MVGNLLTWGQNQNYTLGSGSECAKRFPEKVQLPSNGIVTHCSFSKYHGMCLDLYGNVYSWGLQSNQPGRLGYPEPSVVLTPKRVIFPESSLLLKIGCISTSDNHSVFISTNGKVFVVGSNIHSQLGLAEVIIH